jgi:hypothetical protein
MCDPTFAHQFAMATQADILRQGARDQQRQLGRSPSDGCRLARLIGAARRLTLAPWARLCQTDLTPGLIDLPENLPQPQRPLSAPRPDTHGRVREQAARGTQPALTERGATHP